MSISISAVARPVEPKKVAVAYFVINELSIHVFGLKPHVVVKSL